MFFVFFYIELFKGKKNILILGNNDIGKNNYCLIIRFFNSNWESYLVIIYYIWCYNCKIFLKIVLEIVLFYLV